MAKTSLKKKISTVKKQTPKKITKKDKSKAKKAVKKTGSKVGIPLFLTFALEIANFVLYLFTRRWRQKQSLYQ